MDHITEDQEKSALFIWKGRHSDISGRELSSVLTKQCSPRLFVKEGEEPPCFLQLFQGGMVIYRQHSNRDVGLLFVISTLLLSFKNNFTEFSILKPQILDFLLKTMIEKPIFKVCICQNECLCVSGGWRLFCVRGDVPVEGSLLEVEPLCSSLRSRGSLIMLNSQEGAIYLWHGCKAHSKARQVAKQTFERLKET